MAGKATPSPAPMMPLDSSRGMSMKPSSAAVGVKIVNKDQSTTPPPSTIFEEYLVAMYPPVDQNVKSCQQQKLQSECSSMGEALWAL